MAKVGDGAAALADRRVGVEPVSGDLTDRLGNEALHLVVDADIAAGIDALGAGEADEAGMLARAVVVERRRLASGTGEGVCRGGARGPVRAAFECRFSQPRLRQHARGGLDVARLAAMRGAGEGQFGVAEAVAIGGAALDEGQRLQRLDGGAWIDRLVDVADGEDDLAVGVADHCRTAMDAFDHVAAQNLDEDGIGR